MTTPAKPVLGDIKRAGQLVRHIENTLGWNSQSGMGRVKLRRVMVDRMLTTISQNPTLYTWENLYLTVELLRRKRVQVKSPLFIFFKVEEAVAHANTPVAVSSLADQIAKAVAHEQGTQRDGWQVWVRQLNRAVADYRQDALDEWVAAGRSA